jgi:asparagine synthase (glutamine-hydrolysing)
VRLRLRADVQVGTCLSGGLDSSTIVGLAGQLMDRRVSSFTSIYPGTDSDESDFARAAVGLYDTDAHWVEPRKEDFFGILPRIVWHQDEPTSAPGLYSQWHVMQLAHGEVKVLLDGQGGDEVLAGYLGYYADYTAALLSDVAHGKVGMLGKLRREYGDIAKQLGGQDPLRAAALARAPEWVKAAYRRARRLGLDRNPLIDSAFADHWAPSQQSPIKPSAMRDALNSNLVDSLVRSSIPALLHYEDRNSMAFSIEARVPFLDYRVVQLGLAVPYWAKIRGWETKVILRDAMRDILPQSILERRDKKGYPTPLAMWLREGLMPRTREILLSPEARGRGLLVPSAVETLLDDHEQGRADNHWEIWRLLTLELWYRTYIDSSANAPVTL